VVEVLAIANKLAGATLATLLVIILFGSWKKVWVWGRELTDCDARYSAEKKVIADDRDWWRNVAVRATGLAETQGQILKEVGKVDDRNKGLI
jgi:hypothetical protein